MLRNIFRASILLSLFAPAIALAGPALGGVPIPIVDKPVGGEIVDGATFGAIAKANRSYLCSLRVVGSDSSLSTSILSPSGAPVVGSRPSSAEDASRYIQFLSGVDGADSNSQNNIVFFSALNGQNENGKYTFTMGINSGTGVFVSASCIDTTVVCSFNTFVNDYNFLEVSSFGTQTGVANLALVNFDGVKTSSTSPLIFPAGLGPDVDVHSLVGPFKYGTLFVQALNFVPTIDGYSIPKVSTYKNGELTGSIQCEVQSLFILMG